MDTVAAYRDAILDTLLPVGIERVSLFGSTVRGEQRPGSDIDILVKLKPLALRPPLGLFGWVALEETLTRRLGRPVDLVSEDGLSPYIRPYVEREKVIIYEEG